jgi:hypothetical protein
MLTVRRLPAKQNAVTQESGTPPARVAAFDGQLMFLSFAVKRQFVCGCRYDLMRDSPLSHYVRDRQAKAGR